MFSYKVTDCPPIVSRQHTSYDGTITFINACPPEVIMTRIFPTAWTALHVGLTGLATWLLCENDALSSAAPLFFH
jgi:hypothetical protein